MARRVANTLSIRDVMDMFQTEADAVAWFEDARWGGIPTCSHCGNTERITRPKSKPFTYWCTACHQTFTVRTGSVMEDSKLPTWKWGVAAYYLFTARKGISSLQLSKEIRVRQATAWFLLARLREACRRGEFKLDEIVEIDEVYIGGKNHNRHANKRPKIGQGTTGKQAVLGMRQRRGPTKAMPVSRTDRATLHPLIQQHVEAGAIICTDDHGAYRNLNELGFVHHAVAHSVGEYVRGRAHTNSIESVWSVLRRSLLGVYHSVSRKHLHRYLDETVFRLHEGNCQVDTIDRMRALGKAMGGKRLTYKRLVHGEATQAH